MHSRDLMLDDSMWNWRATELSLPEILFAYMNIFVMTQTSKSISYIFCKIFALLSLLGSFLNSLLWYVNFRFWESK